LDLTTLQKLPVNIELLYVDDNSIQKLQQVSDVQIFDQSGNFAPDGLFSNRIWGTVGTSYRGTAFAYIDLKVELIHPLIYDTIVSLKSFYKDIAQGTTLALWDDKTKAFIKSNEEGADTGYSFFFKHAHELVFEETQSEQRSFLIQLYKKAIKENKYILKYMLVLPAGIRDYTIDASGKPQEDEVNTFYRKLLFQTSLIDKQLARKTPEVYDNIRKGLQNITLDLFEYIKSLLEGKHKLILSKWLSRKVFNSTRNVLSGSIEKVNNINDPNRLGYNECYVGLHQFLRAIVPKSLYEIKSRYIKDIFIENTTFAILTNAKTLKKEEVLNTHIQKDYDLWTSSDGLEKVLANFGNLDIRHTPIVLNKGKHYLGLIYKDEKYFRFMQDIDELPEGYSKERVSPITMAEFLYISIYHLSGKIPGLITRYPITGYGSIYPSMMKLKTTNKYESLEELGSDWTPTGSLAYSFPIRDSDFFNTTAVHTSHYGGLGSDVDGDTISVIALLTDDSIAEVNQQLKKKEYYISAENKFFFSASIDTLDAVLAYMTE